MIAAAVGSSPHPGTCPLCHTIASEISAEDVASGRGWRCKTCHQRWDGARLATVAAYALFVAGGAVLPAE